MRASVTPHVNGALLLAFSFWLGRLGDCRSANNDFFDNIPVDNSPWQPITANRDASRPSSPKFPPVRYPGGLNHPPPQPQWLAPFNRPPAPTTEKFPKPKFPSSIDGYKSYSPGPLYNPNKDFFDSQPPFSPFGSSGDDLKRPPGPKPAKESPAPVYKEPGEVPLLGPKLRPTTPTTFDAFSDSRKKIKFPPPTGSNEKLNALKTAGRYPPAPPEPDQNSVANETAPWIESHGNKRGQSKFHQNSVAVREAPPGQRGAQNRTGRPEVKGPTANELKPQTHVIYSNTAQLVDDSPDEEFHPKDFVPGNIISQITSVRGRPTTTTTKPIENSTERPPANELANTVPILDADKPREPSVSEETSSEAKRKFPFRRPQILTTTPTERPTTVEPSRRPTLKNSLKNRIKLRTSTEMTTLEPEATEPTIKVVKNHKDEAAQSNDIPLKAPRPTVDYTRRRPARPPGQDVPPSGWALASFKNFTSRTTRRPATEAPVTVAATELPAKVRPFVAWSTRLQKMTTTESSVTDMTTMMEDEEEMTTFTPDTLKYPNVVSSPPSTLTTTKGLSNDSKIIDQEPSINLTPNKTVTSEEVNTIRISTNDKMSANSNRNDDKIKEDVTSPDVNENVTDGIDNLENEGSTGLSDSSLVDVKKIANENKQRNDFKVTSTSSSIVAPSKMKNEVMNDKDTETEPNSNDFNESSDHDDVEKPTEKFTAANEEVEFVEASNDSNAHGLDEANDLKPKPLETIYLTDVKSEVVRPVNSIKELNVSSINSSLSNNDSVTQAPATPVRISNYQNNSSQSNELNTEIEFGTLKGVSSQDLGDTKSHPPTSDIPNGIKESHQYHKVGKNESHQPILDSFNRIKGTNEYPTETEEMFEVSFDLPRDVAPTTEKNKLPDVSVSKKFGPSTASEAYSSSETASQSSPSHLNEETTNRFSPSVSSDSDEDIPDFEFSSAKPHLSSEFGGNPVGTDLSTTENIVQSVMNLTSSISSAEPTPQGGLSALSRTPSSSTPIITTTSVQFISPVSGKTSLSEKDIFGRENSTTATTMVSVSGNRTAKPISTAKWPVFETSETTRQPQPSSKFEYTTTTTSITTSALPTTMKIMTSTKKNENIIPPVPDKLDDNNATDEDAYIETDSDKDLFSPTPTRIVTTAKPISSNGTTEIAEADLCPSAMLCPVPLHIQLRIESSQAKVCKSLGKLKTSIIKMFRSGTARVQQAEQIKFIDLNFNQCPKDDPRKETDIKFYLSDGLGDFEQSINEEFIELYGKMGLQDYEPKVESAHLIMNKGGEKEVSVGSDMDGSKTRVIAAVVIICLAVICLILVILLLMIIRKRQKRFNYGQRCVPVTLDDYSLDNISVYNSVRRKGDARASKRSYGNPAFDDPNGPTHRINFAGLANFTSDQNAIDEEFASIPVVAVKPDELPPSAETKNRYANVIPLPETRVHLLNTKTGGCSDYINANYVKGPKREERFYIACQAPLQSTIEDFWRMVWEQQSKVILMLTDFFENGVEKCANYLPPSEVIDCNRVFGDFQVTLKKRENREKYIISSLQLKNLETNSWREVTHLWYTSWPPLGVPNEESSIIAFLIEARVYMKNNTGPNVVHCSPGTGRTGTVIACDLCIRDFELTRMVDVPKCVYMLRRCRAGAVQTKQQYAFIYKVLNLYAAKLTGGGLDSI